MEYAGRYGDILKEIVILTYAGKFQLKFTIPSNKSPVDEQFFEVKISAVFLRVPYKRNIFTINLHSIQLTRRVNLEIYFGKESNGTISELFREGEPGKSLKQKRKYI